MTLRLIRICLAAGLSAVAAGLGAQGTGPGANNKVIVPTPPVFPIKGGDEMVTFKVADLDIDRVLESLETYTGRTVIRPGQLPTALYSLKISRPIPKSELVIALETLLALNQVAVEPMGDRFLKVTALAQAKSEAPEMIEGSTLDLPPSGRIATKIFELEFLRVSEFVPQIQGMLTPYIGGGVVQLEKANTVLITDSVANLQRIERLLAVVDQPRQSSLAPKFYTLTNGAKASDLVTKIHTMLSGPAQNQLRATTTYTADDRTNQIVVIADPREYPLFDALIHAMDIRSDPNTSNEVIPLKHADAKDVSTLLSALISGQNANTQKSASVRPGQIVTPNQPNPVPGQPPVNLVTNGPEGPGNPSGEFSTLINIQADERTNSIVVSGTKDDIRLIRDIVNNIDVLLAQVSIQVIIAEVTLTDQDQSGVSALNLVVGKAPNGGTSITNFSSTVAGWGLTSGVVNPFAVTAALQSAGSLNKVRIVESNTIVTTHNKQAQIVVSTQQPVITGVTQTPGVATTATNGFSTSSSVTYKDIGITLKVTPLVGDDGSVQLTIDQTIDNNQGNVLIDQNQQPIIGHREATSFINVMDGQMVVLGGLQNSSRTYGRQKLGFLYEIPIISNLLGFRMNELDRTELLLFICPHVLKPSEWTADTRRQIEGMSNRAHIQDYLKDPARMPDDKESLKEKFK